MNRNRLDDLSWAMSQVYSGVEDRILINLAKYFPMVQAKGQMTGSFEYQARMLGKMGSITKETVAIIAGSLGNADEALRRSLTTAILDALQGEEGKLIAAAQKGLLTGIPGEIAPSMMQAFRMYYKQSADKLNLVNTVMLESTQAAYTAAVTDAAARIQQIQGTLNLGAGEVITGVSAWNQAMRTTVQSMVKAGITGYIDHAGRRWSPEAYVAMDIKTTMFNTSRAAVWERNQQYNNDLYQVSSHMGARPLCYPWQGKVLSTSGRTGTTTDLDGNEVVIHSEAEVESFRYGGGLFGVNCGHYPMVFIPGFSKLKDVPQDEEENAKTYAESQQQRALERKLREEKRDLEVMKAQGMGEEAIKAQRERVRRASGDLDTFCEETGRHRDRAREYTPIDAKWPDLSTYDPTKFPTAEREKIREWFANGGRDNPPPRQGGMHLGPNNIPPAAQTQIPITPQQVQEVAETPVHAEFTPARTIQEAEEAAKRYVSDYMGAVSYKGIDLEYANACNRVLGEVHRMYDVKPLGSIQPMNMRTKLFKGTTAEAAYRWGGVGGDLFINPTYYKSAKTFAAHKAEIDQLTRTVLDGGDILRSRASGRKLEYIDALLRTKRQCVSQSYDFVEGTFVHECGHMLEDKIFGKKLVEAFGGPIWYSERLAESMRKYGGNISGYAIADNHEYIAESFSAWWFGEGDKIDPIIRAVFEAAIKQ